MIVMTLTYDVMIRFKSETLVFEITVPKIFKGNNTGYNTAAGNGELIRNLRTSFFANQQIKIFDKKVALFIVSHPFL